MVVVAALLLDLFLKCTNGVMPAAKLSAALLACNKRSAICVSDSPEQWCHNAGGLIRIVASWFRCIAVDGARQKLCMSKALVPCPSSNQNQRNSHEV